MAEKDEERGKEGKRERDCQQPATSLWSLVPMVAVQPAMHSHHHTLCTSTGTLHSSALSANYEQQRQCRESIAGAGGHRPPTATTTGTQRKLEEACKKRQTTHDRPLLSLSGQLSDEHYQHRVWQSQEPIPKHNSKPLTPPGTQCSVPFTAHKLPAALLANSFAASPS